MTDLIPTSDLTLIRALVERAGEMDVVDQDTNLAASAALVDVKTLRVRLEERATEMRREVERTITREAKPYIELLKGAEQHLNGISLTWEKEQRDRARAEEEARQEALETAIAEGRHDDAQAALEAQLQPVERPWRAPGTSLRDTWHAEVTDDLLLAAWAFSDSERLRRFYTPNESALNAAARETKGPSTIPGVRFYSETGRAVGVR